LNKYQYIKLFGEKLFDIYGRNVKTIKNIDENGNKYCVWCGKTIITKRRYKYCSDECSQEFNEEYDKRFFNSNIKKATEWFILSLNLKEARNWTCEKCGLKTFELEVHHIIPKCRGGTNKIKNLMVLCKKCHKKETSKLLKDINKLKKKHNEIWQ